MKAIGIRELREHLSEVVQRVEGGETVEITRHGQAVARIVPVRTVVAGDGTQATLVDLETLRAEISKAWPEGVSVQDVIDDIRS